MKEAFEIPEDILNQLKKDFVDEQARLEAQELVKFISQDTLNVGWVQLSRAVIFLSDGNLQKMKEIIQSRYYGDPRDLLVTATEVAKDKFNYGSKEFD